ncbi:MAG: sulfotransferase [Phycisphaeraceae bacterium]|nr:sulfotransferase [Phycisphaeraceae bacterium]
MITNFGPGSQPQSRRKKVIDAARKHLNAREADKAEEVLRPLIHASKPDPEALFLQAAVYELRHRLEPAADLCRRSLAIFDHPEPRLLLARCLRQQGETDEVVSLCDQVLSRHPDSVPAQLIKCGALEEAGRYADAKAIATPLLDKTRGTPAEPMARYEWAKLLVQDKQYDQAVTLIDELMAKAEQPEFRRGLFYLKAKACDRRKDFAGAYESALAANEIGKLEFSPDLYEQQVSILIENWSREKMARFPVSTCDSEVPVFVAGMPRSGTSLIDQIIDAHPKAAGVGELSTIERFAIELAREWDPDKEPPASFGKFDSYRWSKTAKSYVKQIQELAPGAERIVNKALGNNKLVGLIARLFPRTRIIHAIRDPRDVAVSCFMGGFNNALHPWTVRFDWVARAWEQSTRMMEHWKRSLDVPILDVHYERLVRDPEHEFPRIIEFLGLEWDDACRRFHESRRTVRTLSYDQVNRPLYTTSAGRNANYAPFMEEAEFPEYAA